MSYFKIVSMGGYLESRPKALIVVPTANSDDYLRKFLQGIYPDITNASREFDVTLLIVINGTKTGKNLARDAQKFHDKRAREFALTIMVDPIAGKNMAMNRGIRFAKDNGFPLIHFLDDDVLLVGNEAKIVNEALKSKETDPTSKIRIPKHKIESALLMNLRAIRDGGETPMLVGSRFGDIFYSQPVFNSINRIERGFGTWNALVYFTQFISSQIWMREQKHCCGGSLGFRLMGESTPQLPEDKSADDAYFNDYFYLKGEVRVLEHSRGFCRPASSHAEISARGSRIREGVRAAEGHFNQLDIQQGKDYFRPRAYVNSKLKRWFFQSNPDASGILPHTQMFTLIKGIHSARFAGVGGDEPTPDVPISWNVASSTKPGQSLLGRSVHYHRNQDKNWMKKVAVKFRSAFSS